MLNKGLNQSGAIRIPRNVSSLLSVPALALATLLSAPVHPAGADEVRPLKLCADPTNLPFSSDDPAKPGFYLEIGQALAKALDRPVAYDWYKSYFGKRTVRVTLLGKQCDAMVGLPASQDFMGPSVIFSKAIGDEGYALVAAKGHTIRGIADLKGKRVAVQYLSTPQNLLAMRDEIDKVTVMSPEEGMKALDTGKADVAFIWGPVAGWLNKTEYAGKYDIKTTSGEGLLWPVAVGFAKNSTELRDMVDGALAGLQDTIAALRVKYGLPTDKPIEFSAAEAAAAPVKEGANAPASGATVGQAGTVGQAAQAKDAAPTPAAATTPGGNVADGKEVFNGTCSHCHGPDAVQAERHLDLRRLTKRYGDDARNKFWTTVHDGRPAKGMPSWKDVFTDDQLNNVYAFLQTVQDKP